MIEEEPTFNNIKEKIAYIQRKKFEQEALRNKQEQENKKVQELQAKKEEEQFQRFKQMICEFNRLKVKDNIENPKERFQILQSSGLIPEVEVIEKEVYIMQPHKMSEEELEYYRRYREQKKEEQKFKLEEERIENQKIKVLANRRKIKCWTCKKYVPMFNATAKVVLKPNEVKRKIIIEAECPFCKTQCKAFGTFID